MGLTEFYLQHCRTQCSTCYATFYRFHQPLGEDPAPGRASLWTPLENIFLTGIVMDEYYRRHSLKPTAQETASANGERIIWQMIHRRYSVACSRHYRLTRQLLPARTLEALAKHWKETGRRSESDQEQYTVPLSKTLEREWDFKYNAFYILSCPDNVFDHLLQQIETQWGQCHCGVYNLQQ